MANRNNTESYKKAMIDYYEMTITEYDKDDVRVYDLNAILKRWNGIDGITLTIKKDEEITPDKS